MGVAWMDQKRRWIKREWSTPALVRADLRQPLGDWIGTFPWDWWVTLTFTDWIHPERAAQRYDLWARALQEETGRVMPHARATEWQKRGVLHFHALLYNVRRSTNRLKWCRRWEWIGGGHARIVPYDREKRAAYYLGKYLVKGETVEMLTFGAPTWRPDDVRITGPAATLPARETTT